MRISTAFPSKWLRAADLGGRPVVVTMSSVTTEEVGSDQTPTPVLYFDGKEKGLVLNKTNAGKIAELFGDDTDDWTGQQITLFETMVDFRGSTVAAIRVKGAPKSRAQKPAAELIDDDIPF